MHLVQPWLIRRWFYQTTMYSQPEREEEKKKNKNKTRGELKRSKIRIGINALSLVKKFVSRTCTRG